MIQQAQASETCAWEIDGAGSEEIHPIDDLDGGDIGLRRW
jgi:hypothetical protein